MRTNEVIHDHWTGPEPGAEFVEPNDDDTSYYAFCIVSGTLFACKMPDIPNRLMRKGVREVNGENRGKTIFLRCVKQKTVTDLNPRICGSDSLFEHVASHQNRLPQYGVWLKEVREFIN